MYFVCEGTTRVVGWVRNYHWTLNIMDKNQIEIKRHTRGGHATVMWLTPKFSVLSTKPLLPKHTSIEQSLCMFGFLLWSIVKWEKRKTALYFIKNLHSFWDSVPPNVFGIKMTWHDDMSFYDMMVIVYSRFFFSFFFLMAQIPQIWIPMQWHQWVYLKRKHGTHSGALPSKPLSWEPCWFCLKTTDVVEVYQAGGVLRPRF